MADTVYTRLLARATEIEGSTQAVAHRLHVPEATLLRWISGRAQMPFKAYEMLLQFVQQAESDALSVTPSASTNPERLTFPLGPLLARCARCDGTEFRRQDGNAPLLLTSVLECRACSALVIHGDLLVALGHDAMARMRASAVSKGRRTATRRTKAAPMERNVKTATGD